MVEKMSLSGNSPWPRPQPAQPAGGLAEHLSGSFKRAGQAKIPAPSLSALPGLRHFNLQELGIDQDRFIKAIASSFDALPLDSYEQRERQLAYLLDKFPSEREKLVRFLPDYYSRKASLRSISDIIGKLSNRDLGDLEDMGTFQRRGIARFEVLFNLARFPEIKRVSAGTIMQESNLCQHLSHSPRFYPEISEGATSHSCFKQLCRLIALMAKGMNRSIYSLSVTVQQVSVLAQKDQAAMTLETISQHGADYAVCTIPIVLDSVTVPVATVYDSQQNAIYKSRLKVGDGLFLDDRAYKHSIGPIRATADLGVRSTISFDIQITSLEEAESNPPASA